MIGGSKRTECWRGGTRPESCPSKTWTFDPWRFSTELLWKGVNFRAPGSSIFTPSDFRRFEPPYPSRGSTNRVFGKPRFCSLPKKGAVLTKTAKMNEFAFYPLKTRVSLLRTPKTTRKWSKKVRLESRVPKSQQAKHGENDKSTPFCPYTERPYP